MARLEVRAGVATFALAIVTWAVQLFAPVYSGAYMTCPRAGGRCRPGRYSAVDLAVNGNLKYFVVYAPITCLLILAFLFLTGMVALGASLHRRRHVGAARWLVWCGSVLLALLLPAFAQVLIDLSSSDALTPFQIGPSFGLHVDTLLLPLGLCVGLAVLASVAARAPHAEAEAEAHEAPLEGGASPAGATPRAGPPRWLGWVEALAGVAAFALAVTTWAIYLFAPLYSWLQCYSCTPHSGHVSLVDGVGGLSAFVHEDLGFCLLILAFLILTGVVALGAFLHGMQGSAVGRWLVWGGSVLLLIVVPAMAALVADPYPLNVVVSLLSLAPMRYVGVQGDYLIGSASVAFPDLLAVILVPGLCAGLAVIAMLTDGVSDVGTRPT